MKLVRLFPFVALLAAAACGRTPDLSIRSISPSTPAPAPATTVAPPVVATPVATPAAMPAAMPSLGSADATDVPGLRADVVQLSRGAGDVVTLKVTITNDSDRDIDYGNLLQWNMGQVTLDDAIGRKEYHVLGGHGWIASAVPAVPAHSRILLWAKYPAPPADVASISVVLPHFTPIDDVAIR